MPVAIVMSTEGAVPAILMEETPDALVARLRSLTEAPDLPDERAARMWLQSLPEPSGWFASIPEAKAHVQRTHQPAPILPGPYVAEQRQALGMTRADFAEALGHGGNTNTRHKTIFEIENESPNKATGRPRVLNPTAVRRLQALVAEHGLNRAQDQ